MGSRSDESMHISEGDKSAMQPFAKLLRTLDFSNVFQFFIYHCAVAVCLGTLCEILKY